MKKLIFFLFLFDFLTFWATGFYKNTYCLDNTNNNNDLFIQGGEREWTLNKPFNFVAI